MTPEVARFAVTSLKLESSTRKHPWPHGKANANASRSSFASTIDPCLWIHIYIIVISCMSVYQFTHISACRLIHISFFMYTEKGERPTETPTIPKSSHCVSSPASGSSGSAGQASVWGLGLRESIYHQFTRRQHQGHNVDEEEDCEDIQHQPSNM